MELGKNVIWCCSVSALVPTHESLLAQVSVRVKKLEDDAVWIRIAWGDNFTRPNHLKPTYAVHYLQTPYVFILNLTAKHKPFLYQVTCLFFCFLYSSYFYQLFSPFFPPCCIFVCSNLTVFNRSHSQALVLSTRHVSINEAHLSGRSLAALRDLLMKHFQQVKCSWPSKLFNLITCCLKFGHDYYGLFPCPCLRCSKNK